MFPKYFQILLRYQQRRSKWFLKIEYYFITRVDMVKLREFDA